MSYLANPHRPYDSPHPPSYSHTQLRAQTARNIVNMSSYDSLSAQHSAQPPDHGLPKLGETRCYWTLLSSDLRFVYLDPVLSSHLVDQAEDLIGCSLLEFVHPDEQASAKNDLGNVLSTKALHGSVTRMRYSRLSRVRRLLGHQGPPHFWPDADKIAIDSNYLAVDLVINWAADGLVLCFLHAAVDLTPYDNDEHAKTGWSNWCRTNSMTQEQVQVLYSRLWNTIPHSGNMSRVFQLMMNQPGRALLLSWPPDRNQVPSARDFAKLSSDVQIGGDAPGTSDAKTTCTRRYKASSTIQTSDGFRDVESVYIPHGCIIFACHSVSSDSRSASEDTAPLQQAEYDAPYMTQGPQYYPQSTSYGLPPMQSSTTTYSNYLSQQNSPPTASQVTSQYSSQQGWSSVIDPPPPSLQYGHWSSTGAQTGSPAYHPSSQQPRQPSYAIHQSPHWGSAAFPEADSPLPPSYRSLSPGYTYSSPENNQSSSGSMETVPPPRGSRRPTPPGGSREHSTGGGRASGNPPMGISRCSSCRATTSPEWRKGPSGKKDLCNACGLRYARSRAKKEGITTQRRRKDKVITMPKQEPPSGAAATVPPIPVPYNNLRRSSYDDTFLSSSAGSASGNETYTQSPSLHGPSGFDNLTPSPSPPAGSGPFTHYNPQSQSTRQADSRGHYTVQSGSLYPSPLSHPPLQSQGLNHTPSSLPPLPLVLNRASPILSSTSSDSALSSAVPASFERERHRDAVALPQVPLSEPRRLASNKTTFVTP